MCCIVHVHDFGIRKNSGSPLHSVSPLVHAHGISFIIIPVSGSIHIFLHCSSSIIKLIGERIS
ncbi:MAG: hypothetical protein Q8S84_03710 [bacterium]|nr:hypothetical protein [bacterium]